MIVLPSAKSFSTYNPSAEVAVFRTKKSAGTFGAVSSFSASSNSGAFRVNWWDGTTTTYSANVGFQAALKAVVAPYNTTAEKEFSITPVNSSGQQSGQLTGIVFSDSARASISFIDIKGLSKLETFNCDSGTDLTSYTHNGRINNLAITSSGLTSISFPEGSRTSVVNLDNSSSLSTVNGLQNLKSLNIFRAANGILTSLDFSNLINLYHIGLYNQTITSLRAQNCSLFSDTYSSYSYFTGGALISQTSLNRTALVQFFNDLANGNGYINVSAAFGQPDLTLPDAAILTGKGYTLLGGP